MFALSPGGRGLGEGAYSKFFTASPKLGSCEIIPQITPTFPLPHLGGGNNFFISICSPSPLAGEGRVRGLIPIFSHLLGERGRGKIR
jgi:hypothetical protein